MNIEPTVPCQICGKPTAMLGTKLCDPCWELDSRLDEAMRRNSPRFDYMRNRCREFLRDAEEEDARLRAIDPMGTPGDP